ncbi:MAG: YibE/F family protein [bacterium]|nr:YibE/F family protein [bacterium]
MTKKFLLCLVVLFALSGAIAPRLLAQERTMEFIESSDSAIPLAEVPETFPKDEYYKGRVEAIGKEEITEFQGFKSVNREITVKLLEGPEKDKSVTIKYTQLEGKENIASPKIGDTVVITKSELGTEGPTYVISDRYRLRPVMFLLATFFILIVIFGKLKGFTATIGLAVSVLIIVQFIVPKIASGSNPFMITMAGILLIAFSSLYLAHGFSKRTTIALISTLITLGISVALAVFAVNVTQLNGLGSEEAMFLQAGVFGAVNLKGLLLGGILIGTLGVLDDITTSQAAAIDEISKANPSLKFAELYRSGINVGHEHIASLVNTLFLAYAGASLPLFLLLSQAQSGQPLWTILNSEQFVEEIVRTIVGSIALILGVPVSTILSAWFFSKRSKKELQ